MCTRHEETCTETRQLEVSHASLRRSSRGAYGGESDIKTAASTAGRTCARRGRWRGEVSVAHSSRHHVLLTPKQTEPATDATAALLE
eukprot:6142828-Pleurochrysis_carterae.AAC.1